MHLHYTVLRLTCKWYSLLQCLKSDWFRWERKYYTISITMLCRVLILGVTFQLIHVDRFQVKLRNLCLKISVIVRGERMHENERMRWYEIVFILFKWIFNFFWNEKYTVKLIYILWHNLLIFQLFYFPNSSILCLIFLINWLSSSL